MIASQKIQFIISILFFSFMLALPGPGYATVENPAGYENAKIELASLRSDERRSQYRHEWLKVADAFYSIYERNPNWANRPASLFRSAEALEEMARRSFVRKDAQDAAARFEQLAENHSDSVLADDALYRAAVIRNELMRDPEDSIQLLGRLIDNYPGSDFLQAAREYLAGIDGSSVASIAPTALPRPETNSALVTRVTPQLRDNGVIRLIVSVDRSVSWRIKYYDADLEHNLPPRLVLDINDALPERDLSVGELYSDMNVLTRYAFDFTCEEGDSRIVFDFADLYHYTVKAERSPFRIIIEATAVPEALQGGITVKDEIVPVPDPAKPAVPDNLLGLLGLRVNRIVIDPGHGGKDPGTMHNNLVEREVALDIAQRLAAILVQAGYEVIMTREEDVFLSLTERANLAVASHGDLLVSVHVNANNNPAVAGLETYYLDLAGTTEAQRIAAVENEGSIRGLGEMERLLTDILLSARRTESRQLASQVQERMLSTLRAGEFTPQNGGVKGAPFHVLMGTSMPGILVEVGYCSNDREAALLRRDDYRDLLARGIAEGIFSYSLQLEATAVQGN